MAGAVLGFRRAMVRATVVWLVFFLPRFLRCRAIYARSNPGDPPEYCTLFNHMVKSGGSSIKEKLAHSAMADGVATSGLCVQGPNTEEKCLHAVSNSAVITGYTELLRAPLERIGRQCEYFTMMRHPIDRLVSAFFYCPSHDMQNRPSKWCGDRQDPAPLTDRLLEYAQERWQNKAFNQMSYSLFCPSNAFCEQSRPPAPTGFNQPGGWKVFGEIAGILGTYAAVGILEHWDLSMQLFDAKVKSPVTDWQTIRLANAGQMSGIRDEIVQWAHSSPEIHEALATDMLLYDFSLSLFKLQTKEALGTVWP